MQTAQINIRIDAKTKKQVEEIANGIGLGLNDVFRVMAKKFAENRGFPFELVYPYTPNYNNDVWAALDNVKAGKNLIKVKGASGLAKFLGVKNA